MQKFISLIALAIFAIGCKGGDTTAATTGGETTGSATTGTSAPAGDTVTLKLNPTQGETYNYVITSEVMGQKNNTEMSMKCEKVEGDKITMVTTVGSIKITTVSDTTGKVQDTKVEGAPAGTPAPETNSLAFPAGPIKVGDTWDGSMKMQGTEIKAHYKLAKVEDGVATIESTMEGLPATITLDGPGVTQLDLKTGMPISTLTKMKMKGPDGKEMAIVSEMKKK